MFLLDSQAPGSDPDLVYSASDLVLAVQCEYAVLRGLDEKLGRSIRPNFEPDAMLGRAAELGDVHERKVLRGFIDTYGVWDPAAGSGVYDVVPATAMSRDALTAKHQESVAAMAAGADVVFQAAFFDGSFHGRSDFLVKQDDGGRVSYAVYDTKLARHAKVSALLQLAAYGDQLEQAGIPPSSTVSLILGNGAQSDHSLTDILPVFHQRRRRFLNIVDEHRAASGPVRWGDTRYSACGRCDYCSEQVQLHRDLLLVANMRASRRKSLIDAGITTIDELAAMDMPAGTSGTGALAKLRDQARMQTGAVQTDGGRSYVDGSGEPKSVSYRVLETNTLDTLPPPSPGDIFFDFEGDPLWQDPATGSWGIEYLFGVVENPAAEGEKPPFIPFWAHNKAEERQALVGFLDYVRERRRKYPQLRIYHYANYEKAALRRLSLEHVVGEDAVDELLRQGVLVDLYETVRNSLRISERSYSIKKLEPLYMGDDLRSGDVTDAGASIVAYANYCTLRDSGEPGSAAEAERILAGIGDYNEYDCLSTLRLRDWLLQLAAERGIKPARIEPSENERPPYEPGPEEAALLEHVEAAVRQSAAEGRALGPDDQAIAMVAAAVGYHRREDKQFWWGHFDRCLSPVEEWADTRNVFVVERAEVSQPPGLEPRARKLSRRLRLSGTLADGSDLRTGGKPYLLYAQPFPNRLQSAAGTQDLHVCARGGQEIKDISTDGDRTVLEIREMLPDDGGSYDALPLAVTPEQPLRTDAQQRALKELAVQVGGALPRLPQRPALDLLARRNPRLATLAELPTVTPGEDGYVRAITAAVADLDHSYLAVQGPPGSGKTYVGARVIAALVQNAGWRIGVVAQSHAVVENLLTAVIDAGLDPQQVAKKAAKNAGPIGGPWRQLTNANELPAFVAQGACVVGGTAWDFADEKRFAEQGLDLLVIDEAGQYSLANTLAVSRAAQRLLLLGDPQQLPQVTQGTHPEPVDVSALGWLSAGGHTLSAAKGYFLALSWRMHPALCARVSALSYDGLLHSAPAASARELDGAAAGIATVLVEHAGNSVCSSEEAAEVVRQVREHLGLPWRDGPTRRELAQQDILVVAAYNAQVQLIAKHLAHAGLAEVRVGTVDKFQGQEAAVVIISMAVSAPEEAPRGMDFLLSRNRVNVAISRGQWRAVIVRSPRLIDYLPTTPPGLEQLGAFIGLCEGPADRYSTDRSASRVFDGAKVDFRGDSDESANSGSAGLGGPRGRLP